MKSLGNPMYVTVSLEQRFDRTPDGAVWTPNQFPLSFWQRYLEVFDGVRIVARTRHVDTVPDGAVRVDGEGVDLFEFPHYLGPGQYLLRLRQVRRAAGAAVAARHAVILRISSQIGNCLEPHLVRQSRPYGVEVVGDPWDVFAPRVVTHPLRALFRRYFAACLRRQCRNACAAAYVTESALQRRYPPAKGVLSISCSDVELPEDAIRTRPRNDFCSGTLPRLITVASLAQRYKGIDVLIDAVALCVREGFPVYLTIVGDGVFRDELQARADCAGCADSIAFLGSLPAGEAVRGQLDEADLFVLPSRVEGLPRALIEAMARGLPCIGTSVGGIPEILPEEDRIPADNATALAAKIREIIANNERMRQSSHRNLGIAARYRDDRLQKRRILFYSAVRDSTEQWLARRDVASEQPRIVPRDAPVALHCSNGAP